ncbi:DUF3856 domain-containing protein [Nocardia sp. NPDC048505]|uniref:DUF3856 domain-containing protein n=1 Tax=unclassified Nocardia TaxID=2637762 RepID=UPI0033DD4E02
MERDQVLGVSAVTAGSGYLIAPRLMLTSAHVVGRAGKPVNVFRPGRAGTFTGTVVWCGRPGGRADAALVEIDDPGWISATMAPVVWGKTVTYVPGTPCRSWGLPTLSQRAGEPMDLEQFRGTLNPGDQIVSDRYLMRLDTHPPTGNGDGTPWAGMSGAAMYCGDLLTGVVATDPAARGHATLGAVPAYVLLLDPEFCSTITRYAGEDSLRCEPIELQQLMDRQSALNSSTAINTPASLLTARRAVVDFHGRDDELRELHGWVGRPGVGAYLLYGAGGQGKTRLAHHFGESLTATGWTVLWLDPAVRGEPLRILTQVAGRLLLVLDYAESRPDQVTELFKLCGRRLLKHPVKLLLLARTAGAWWQELAGGESLAEIVETAGSHELQSLDATRDEQDASYRRAVQAFADTLPRVESLPRTDWSGVARLLGQAIPRFAEDLTVLSVQMRALVDLLDAAGASSVPPGHKGARLEDRVLRHERDYWQLTARSVGITPNVPLTILSDVVTASVLLAPTDADSVTAAIRQVPEFADQTALVVSTVRDWLMNLYPGDRSGVFVGLAPDRVAEQLVGRSMLEDHRRSIVDALIATVSDDRVDHLLTVCTRAVAHTDLGPAAAHLTRWCVEHAHALLPAALRVALQVEAPDPLLAGLEGYAADTEADLALLTALREALPGETQVLASAAVCLLNAIVDRHRSTPDKTDLDLANLAGALSQWANRLHRVGRRDDAVTAATESVTLFRELRGRHDNLSSHLAIALGSLAQQLGDVGRRDEGMAAASEAVAIARTLHDTHPDVYPMLLGSCLYAMATRLHALGRPDEALAAVTETVDIYRRLEAADPVEHRGRLAVCLTNLAAQLDELGRWDECLAAAIESVELHRRMVETRTDGVQQNLATCLNNLAIWLGQTGRNDEALQAATEALTLQRKLARRHPDYYAPAVALALDCTARQLHALGRSEEALAAAVEAVEIIGEQARSRPELYVAERGSALNTLATQLNVAGRYESAAAAAADALDIFRNRVADHPEAFRRNLAKTLDNYALQLAALGRRDEALAAATEAVDLHRELAMTRPEAIQPDLAKSLHGYADILWHAARRDEALQALSEAIDIQRALALSRPRPYLPELIDLLETRGSWLRDLDRYAAARSVVSEGLANAKLLADRNPGAAEGRVTTLRLLAAQLDEELERGDRGYRDQPGD